MAWGGGGVDLLEKSQIVKKIRFILFNLFFFMLLLLQGSRNIQGFALIRAVFCSDFGKKLNDYALWVFFIQSNFGDRNKVFNKKNL